MFGTVKEPVVSIVMPVYNAEDHLEESLRSVLEQTYKNLEIICVDDGSTDSGPAAIERLARKDSRIKMLSQENSGAGVARNKGMDEAKGDYLFFFDADDLLHKNAIRTLVNISEKKGTDIVLFGYSKFDGRRRIRVDFSARTLGVPLNRVISPKEISDRLFQADHGMPWNKFYRTDFLTKSGIRFQSLRNTNDEYFSRITTVEAEHILFLNKRFAGYRVGNKKSLRGNADANVLDCTRALLAIHDELKLRGCFETYEDTYKKLAGYVIMLKLLSIEDNEALKEFAADLYGGTLEKCEADEKHLEERFKGIYRALILHDTAKVTDEIMKIRKTDRTQSR